MALILSRMVTYPLLDISLGKQPLIDTLKLTPLILYFLNIKHNLVLKVFLFQERRICKMFIVNEEFKRLHRGIKEKIVYINVHPTFKNLAHQQSIIKPNLKFEIASLQKGPKKLPCFLH